MKVFFGMLLLVCLCVIPYGIAHAYSVQQLQPIQSSFNFDSGFNNLLLPFQNFIQSLAWPDIGSFLNLNLNNGNPLPTSTLKLSALPLLILNAVIWMLNVALQIVNWLKSLL